MDKPNFCKFLSVVFLCSIISIFLYSPTPVFAASPDVFATIGTFSWTAPTGIFAVTAACWGGGAGGGGSTSTSRGAG